MNTDQMNVEQVDTDQINTDQLNTITAYDIGQLGTILKVNMGENVGKVTVKPEIIWIVDRSGSMGQNVDRLMNKVIPDSMLNLGYKNTHIANIITFDSKTEILKKSVNALINSNISSRGVTNMSPVFDHMTNIIHNDQTKPYCVVVLSDGDVHDKKEVAEHAKKNLQYVKGVEISVIAVRLGTPSGNSADTQALANVALYNTQGYVPVKDFVLNEHSVTQLTTYMTTELEKSGVGVAYGELSCPAKVFTTMPTEDPVYSIRLPKDMDKYVIVDKNTDFETILINGKSISSMLRRDIIKSEFDIKTFVENSLQWMKIRKVSCVDFSDDIVSWFDQLNRFIEHNSDSSETNSVQVRDRINRLKKTIQKRTSSAMNELLQMNNQTKLSTINSNQTADYLRGDLKSTGAAKRMEKYTNGESFDDIANGILTKLNELKETHNIDEQFPVENISFFSQSGCTESVLCAADLKNYNPSIFDLLTSSGFLGLCFNCNQCDLPDPWIFEVNEVFLGNYYLTEADLRTENTIEYPGTHSEVNGILPLMKFNESLYKEYVSGKLRKLAEAQASVSIRGMLGPITQDILAMNAAVLKCIVEQVDTSDITTIQKDMIENITKQMQFHFDVYANNTFELLGKSMCMGDPRVNFVGSIGGNSLLKLFCVLTFHKDCESVRTNTTQLKKLLAVFYELDCYMAAKKKFKGHDEDYNETTERYLELLNVLCIDIKQFERSYPVGEPYHESAELINVDDITVDVDACVNNITSWLPNDKKYSGLYRLITGKCISDADRLFDLENDQYKIMKLHSVVQAIQCRIEDDRINKEDGHMKIPLPYDHVNCKKYIEQAIYNIYSDNYNKRMLNKRAKEHDIMYFNFVKYLTKCDADEFVSCLNGEPHNEKQSNFSNNGLYIDVVPSIKNRSARGYAELVSMLVDTSSDVTDRLNKIKIIITGRDLNKDPVWCSGNVLSKKLEDFMSVFDYYNKKPEWNNLMAIVMEFKKWIYRESDKKNRHGHCNSKPSFFSYGFETLSEFEFSCKNGLIGFTPDDWTEYKTIHTTCCGFHSYVEKHDSVKKLEATV